MQDVNNNEQNETLITRPPKLRHYYKAPWSGGTFDLGQVAAVNYDNDRCTIQLRGGGFQRSPAHHPEAKRVAEDIERTLATLDGNVVHCYEEKR